MYHIWYVYHMCIIRVIDTSSACIKNFAKNHKVMYNLLMSESLTYVSSCFNLLLIDNSYKNELISYLH